MRAPRFRLRSLVLAVAILAFVFAALRYDIGMRGYILFVAAGLAFAAAAAVAARTTGRPGSPRSPRPRSAAWPAWRRSRPSAGP